EPQSAVTADHATGLVPPLQQAAVVALKGGRVRPHSFEALTSAQFSRSPPIVASPVSDVHDSRNVGARQGEDESSLAMNLAPTVALQDFSADPAPSVARRSE